MLLQREIATVRLKGIVESSCNVLVTPVPPSPENTSSGHPRAFKAYLKYLVPEKSVWGRKIGLNTNSKSFIDCITDIFSIFGIFHLAVQPGKTVQSG
jgi:hypothetical protein